RWPVRSVRISTAGCASSPTAARSPTLSAARKRRASSAGSTSNRLPLAERPPLLPAQVLDEASRLGPEAGIAREAQADADQAEDEQHPGPDAHLERIRVKPLVEIEAGNHQKQRQSDRADIDRAPGADLRPDRHQPQRDDQQ